MKLSSEDLSQISLFTGFSFIVAHRPTDDIAEIVKWITSGMRGREVKFEIISVMGNHPTYQRNRGANKAKYSHLYFLDDDSRISRVAIDKVIEILRNENHHPLYAEHISLIGGPTLLFQPASYFEECVQGVLSTAAVIGKIKARYRQIGEPRFSNDQELILCNLVINKKTFEQLHQFDIKLYPNEENDFISRLLFAKKEKNEKHLGKVLYHPEVCVQRPQRKSYTAFIKQMLGYGRGRAEQTKNNLQTLHWHLLLAIGFFLVFLAFLFILPTQLDPSLSKSSHFIKYGLSILINGFLFYFLYTLWVLVKISSREQKILLHIPLLVFCCHFFYGLGMFIGFFQKGYRTTKKKVSVKIRVLIP